MTGATRDAAHADLNFDFLVRQAMAKWPNVPACSGWLRLDARGRWRLQGELVNHVRIEAFFARNYADDADGRWFVQNGPQRVYVGLDRAPWCLRLSGDGKSFVTHTELAVRRLEHLILADTGDIYLATERGLGLICDRDLSRFVTQLCAYSNTAEAFFETPQEPNQNSHRVPWHGHELSLMYVLDGQLEQLFKFVREPSI